MSLIRLYIFASFMSVLVALPMSEAINFSNISSYSLTKFSDYGNEENKSEDNHDDFGKDEKTEFQIAIINNCNSPHYNKPLYQKYQEPISNFNQDIFTPPPEQV